VVSQVVRIPVKHVKKRNGRPVALDSDEDDCILTEPPKKKLRKDCKAYAPQHFIIRNK
jgi:hypothetical protein